MAVDAGGFAIAFWPGRDATAGDMPAPIVRIAELEIDPAQLERYRAAVREEMEISVRVEPGVVAIYSVGRISGNIATRH